MFSSPTDSSFLRAAASQSSIRLKEVRDRLDSVVDYVVDGIVTIDDGGLIEALNPSAEKLFGYSAAELIGRSVSLLVSAPPDSGVSDEVPAEPKIRLAEIAGTGREVVGRRKDGSIFPIDLAVSSFSRGGREFFTGIIRDISERKKLEFEQHEAHHKLQEANERLRSVVDYVVDGIVTIDERGTIASWNRSAEGIFGYSAAEMIGENIARLMPEPHRGEHDEHLAQYAETGIAKVVGINREMLAQRKDGAIFPIDLAVSEYVLQGKRLFTGIIRDITERKRTDERTRFLVSATALLTSVVDSSSLLTRIAKLPVPVFADWCIVDLCGPQPIATRPPSSSGPLPTPTLSKRRSCAD